MSLSLNIKSLIVDAVFLKPVSKIFKSIALALEITLSSRTDVNTTVFEMLIGLWTVDIFSRSEGREGDKASSSQQQPERGNLEILVNPLNLSVVTNQQDTQSSKFFLSGVHVNPRARGDFERSWLKDFRDRF